MTAVVIDTNVILVANRQHADVSEQCIYACAARLQEIMKPGGRVAIDNQFKILNEYQHKATPHGGKRAGDVFLKWLLRNNANPDRCDQVALVAHADRVFESFPDNPALANFDQSDRKFVAVAAAHASKPRILQATDSKWLEWARSLKRHGIIVDFLCPRDIKEFNNNKKAGKKATKR